MTIIKINREDISVGDVYIICKNKILKTLEKVEVIDITETTIRLKYLDSTHTERHEITPFLNSWVVEVIRKGNPLDKIAEITKEANKWRLINQDKEQPLITNE